MNLEEIISKLSLEEKIRLCMDESNTMGTAPLPKYGIPKLIMTDGTNGVRMTKGPVPDPKTLNFMDGINYNFDSPEALEQTAPATCFPAGASLACSWDPALAGEVGAAVAKECKSLGAGMLLGPGLNTRRSPMDGRGFEYYSEDPVLGGDMASAYVKGVQKNGVAACLKHFACNNANNLRTKYDNLVDERALHEIYLAGFERAVKNGKPAAVMASYNKINGVHSCENKWLLTDILREKWGFDGLVISDAGAVKDHAAAFGSGLDFQMPISKIGMEKLIQAVENGVIPEEVIDTHCQRVLRIVFQYSCRSENAETADMEAHHILARKAAAESAVLLKNEDQILPLSEDASLAVIGRWAKEPVYCGTGCAIVRAQKVDIPFEEIKKHHRGTLLYADGYRNGKDADEALIREAQETAEKVDYVVIFAGAPLPAESDEYNRTDLNIEPAHEALIRKVAEVNPNIVVVLSNSESVVMPWLPKVRAVLDCWYCGEGFGYAATRLLFGKENPGGKLAATMPVRREDCPDFLHFPGENYRHQYAEGIYVGYRYYEKKNLQPLFPFGHGLSYTSFEYADLHFSKDSYTMPEDVEISFTVKNTGKIAGSEIAQLYVADRHARLHRPVKELKAFKKLFLKPGESKTVTLRLTKRDFAYYDPMFSDWVVESGAFEIQIGASSADIRLTGSVQVCTDKTYELPIEPDSHYIDVLKNEHAKKVLFECLEEWGLAKKEDLTEDTEKRLGNSFWGMAQLFDNFGPWQVSEEMILDMVDKMNRRKESASGRLQQNAE